jgi:hypothetical protein
MVQFGVLMLLTITVMLAERWNLPSVPMESHRIEAETSLQVKHKLPVHALSKEKGNQILSSTVSLPGERSEATHPVVARSDGPSYSQPKTTNSTSSGMMRKKPPVKYTPAKKQNLKKHVDGKATTEIAFQTSAHACPKKSVDQLGGNLKSQSDEDKTLLTKWFNGICNGTYIEMGALDGLRFSNSFVFHKQFGWKGLLVELGPKNYQRLVQNRPDELATVLAGVCDGETTRTLHYVEKNAVGGIWEFSSPSFREQWWKGIDLNSKRVKTIECRPLQDIIDQHILVGGGQFFFDFFSLDVEGAELEALQSIDFSRVGFGILFAEADAHDPAKNMAMRNLVESKGYTFLMEQSRSYWFINDKFSTIYRDLIPSES